LNNQQFNELFEKCNNKNDDNFNYNIERSNDHSDYLSYNNDNINSLDNYDNI
jgi:hypothetical protein